jgi:hypothetical protein
LYIAELHHLAKPQITVNSVFHREKKQNIILMPLSRSRQEGVKNAEAKTLRAASRNKKENNWILIDVLDFE